MPASSCPFEQSHPWFPAGFSVSEVAADLDRYLRKEQSHHIQPPSMLGPPPYPQQSGGFTYRGRDFGPPQPVMKTRNDPVLYSRPSPTTTTVNARQPTPRAPVEASAGSVVQSIERSTTPQPREQNATPSRNQARLGQSPAKTLDPESQALMHRLNLPQSIIDYGFSPQDFDPTTTYDSKLSPKKPSPHSFKPFPPDLTEEHIFNANPRYLSYDNILRIAPKYNNGQIAEKINANRPVEVVKEGTVGSRIRKALETKADSEQTPGGYEGMKTWLKQKRRKNGVKQ